MRDAEPTAGVVNGCLPCTVTQGTHPSLRATMHRSFKHWQPHWLHPSKYVMTLCAQFWEFGRQQGRAEAAAEDGQP